MSPIIRLLRRFPPFRKGVYARVLQIRAERKKQRWDYVQSVFVLIGSITITWAAIERMLDELISWYQHNCIDTPLEHPVSLKRKLAFLRAMQCDERFTPEAQAFFRQVRLEAKRIGNERHELIHGSPSHRGAFSLHWQTRRVVYNGTEIRVLKRDFHNDDLRRIAKEISDFAGYLGPKLWILIGRNPSHIPMSEVEKALRELGFT